MICDRKSYVYIREDANIRTVLNLFYNPQNEMFAAFETNRSLLKNETYPKIKKFSPGFAGV